jgi:hypothetical protein
VLVGVVVPEKTGTEANADCGCVEPRGPRKHVHYLNIDALKEEAKFIRVWPVYTWLTLICGGNLGEINCHFSGHLLF